MRILLFFLLFVSTTLWASGYEKSIMWGGKSAGLAGIATPYVQGSEALYFNPAGMLGEKTGDQDVSFHISPTWLDFSAPINNENTIQESEKKMLTPASLLYARTISDRWAYGVGFYNSAGAFASYENVNFSGMGSANIKTDLQVNELSLGVAYRANNRFKLGVAWRVAMAKAELEFVQRQAAGVMVAAKLSGLKDTQYNGFRLGAQYELGEKTKLGLTYRSPFKFAAEGDMQVTRHMAGTPTDLGTSKATARTEFPMAVTLGASQEFSETWQLFGEYAWTNYAKIDNIPVESPDGAVKYSEVELRWRNQSNIRLAAENSTFRWPIRFGYGWTSQVARNELARAYFAPPGQGHTLTLGTGRILPFEGSSLALDGGLEYTWITGDGHGAESGDTSRGSDSRSGEYSVTETALHFGMVYAF